MKGVLKTALLFVALVSTIAGCGPDSILVTLPGETGSWDLGDERDSDVGIADDLGAFIDLGAQDMDASPTPFDMSAAFDLASSGDLGVALDMNAIDMNASSVEDMGQEPERDQGTTPPVDPCAGQDRSPPRVSQRGALNDNPKFLQVYVNNIENLETPTEQCPGDWQDLIAYMKTVKPAPDVFLVQQISNRQQLDVLIAEMNRMLPGKYAGFLSENQPSKQRTPCGPPKAYQTNGIIYRTARLEPRGSRHVWQSWAFRNGGCRRNFQARTKNVVSKFYDRVAKKTVTVASLHWSTAQGTGPDPACALKNVREANRKLHESAYRADLTIFGGDLNESDLNSSNNYKAWFKEVNGEVNGGRLNYRDAIFHDCKQKSGNLKRCLQDNHTTARARIDFLFAQDRDRCRARMRRANTIAFDAADAAAKSVYGSDHPANYSDHRAIRAEIYY